MQEEYNAFELPTRMRRDFAINLIHAEKEYFVETQWKGKKRT